MTEELIVFTHNDLDAAGCMLNIEYKWPNIDKVYFHTNYSNIPQIVSEIEAHIKKNGNKHILIVDVSFSDHKDSLEKLYNLGKCTHIDHHMYPDGFWDEFPDMKVVWDKEKCATLLVNEYLGNTGKNSNLDKLSKIIDIYDIWQVKHPAFDFSQDLNDYFWKAGIENFVESIKENDWKLPDDFAEEVAHIRRESDMAIQSYEERKLIHRASDITLAFVNGWFNQVLIPEMRNGQNFVIGINSHGIVRVRINQDSPYTDEQKNSLRFALIGAEDHGHMNAFTYKVDNPKFENLIKEAEKVVEKIDIMKGVA